MEKINDLKIMEKNCIWRRRNKLKQSDVAKFMEVSIGLISKLELGSFRSARHYALYAEFIKQFEDEKAKAIKELS